jgi:hypothetical protein
MPGRDRMDSCVPFTVGVLVALESLLNRREAKFESARK